jgi:hypothetical protein
MIGTASIFIILLNATKIDFRVNKSSNIILSFLSIDQFSSITCFSKKSKYDEKREISEGSSKRNNAYFVLRNVFLYTSE